MLAASGRFLGPVKKKNPPLLHSRARTARFRGPRHSAPRKGPIGGYRPRAAPSSTSRTTASRTPSGSVGQRSTIEASRGSRGASAAPRASDCASVASEPCEFPAFGAGSSTPLGGILDTCSAPVCGANFHLRGRSLPCAHLLRRLARRLGRFELFLGRLLRLIHGKGMNYERLASLPWVRLRVKRRASNPAKPAPSKTKLEGSGTAEIRRTWPPLAALL